MLSTRFHKPPTNFCPATLSTSLPCSLTARLVQIERPVQRISGHRSVNKGTSQKSGSSWGSWVLNQCKTHLYEIKKNQSVICHTYRRLNLLLQTVTQIYKSRTNFFFLTSGPSPRPTNVGYRIKLNKSCTPTLGGQEDSKVSQQWL